MVRPSSRSKLSSTVLVCLLVGALAGIVPQSATAASNRTNDGYYTIGSRTWTSFALVQSANKWANAHTQTYSDTSATGTSGSRGRLFSGYAPNGPMSCEGSNVFNSGSKFASACSCTRTTTNTWWSWGVSLAWNGGGYQSFYTFKTTSVNS